MAAQSGHTRPSLLRNRVRVKDAWWVTILAGVAVAARLGAAQVRAGGAVCFRPGGAGVHPSDHGEIQPAQHPLPMDRTHLAPDQSP